LVGVFMAATSIIGIRFDALPQWLSRLGLVLGGLLGVTGAFAGPLDFLFPVWLTVVSGCTSPTTTAQPWCAACAARTGCGRSCPASTSTSTTRRPAVRR
jgi:hypothetical protein